MEPPRSSARTYTRLPDADKLQTASTALVALETEAEIIAAMSPRKYAPGGPKLAEGRALLAAARALTDDQTEDVGDRLSATRAQDDLLEDAHAVYAPLAATARVVFEDDPDALAALGLTGQHSNAYAARLARYRGFAVEARKPERLARLSEETDDIRAASFDELEAEIEAASRAMTAQDHTEARSEDATAVRRAALNALQRWMLTMHGHARVVLRRRPPLLEMLGVPPRR